MARLIMKSPYMKSNSKRHKGNYVSYIATRDGVEFVDSTKKHLPPTKRQSDFVDKLIKRFPDTADLFEYKDYLNHPSRENASEYIMRVSEMHYGDREKYVSYIAERPRVEKLSTNGLFTDKGVPIVLSEVQDEIAKSESNIWTHIISLKREDAKNLGFDNAEAWMQLLRTKRNDFAKNMKIKPENFRWYAAFHNESHHPHVHMIAYSIDPNEAYLSKQGIENIKSSLAKDIFKDERINIFKNQTEYRDKLKKESENIISTMDETTKRIYPMLLNLASELSSVTGKKVYGYLKPSIKMLVDSIVNEIAKDERIENIYDSWYEEKYKILKLYSDSIPDKIPLSKNDEFKSIKNMIIRMAMDIDTDEPAPKTSTSHIKTDETVSEKDTHDVEIIEKEYQNNNYIAFGTLRLLEDISRLIKNNISEQRKINNSHIESKEKHKINDKKEAQGLKM